LTVVNRNKNNVDFENESNIKIKMAYKTIKTRTVSKKITSVGD